MTEPGYYLNPSNWMTDAMNYPPQPSDFPAPPPSRMDQAFDTSIDRWKQLAKDVFFAPVGMLNAPPWEQAMGLVGTFGGPLAKTANRAALVNAERMATKGATREAIWDQTGWFQGPDQKWRFEIPDNASSLNLTPEINGARVQANTVGMALEHPELLAAYPELSKVKLNDSARPGGGYYDRGRNLIGLGPTHNDATKSVLLHEAQHFIQEGPEGFARGGSSRAIPPELIAQERQRINSIPEKGWGSVSPAGDLPDDQLAHHLYRRLAGEVEARAVQNRMQLTPEQRRVRYPWIDYDVPIEQQIIYQPPTLGLR